MKKKEIIRLIREQHERDVISLVDFLEESIPDDEDDETNTTGE